MSRTKAERAAPVQPASPSPAGRSPRRTQAERSETTRHKLIEATVKLLRTRGYGGLRTVEIAAVAGVSRGAQMHHFPTKDTLVAASVRHLNDRMLDRARQRVEAARANGDPIGELIADACDFFFGDYFFITLALNTSDERNEDLSQVAQSLMAPSRFAVEREWLAALQQAGLGPELARDVLTLTMSMVRGFGVRTLLVESRDRFARELALWRRMVDEYLAAHGARMTPAELTARPSATPRTQQRAAKPAARQRAAKPAARPRVASGR